VATRLVHVVADAANPQRQAEFWSKVFGWQTKALDSAVMVLPAGWRYPDPGPLPLLFEPASEPKTGRNRLHFDLLTKSAAFKEDLVKRILGLGATPADIGQGDVPWEVLADPEGNEFCVLDPRPGIYFDTGPIAAVVANSADPDAVAPVWAEATGWRRSKSASHDGLVAMRAPHVPGPFVELLRVAGAELGGCRIRLDVAPTLEDDFDESVAGLLAAGAKPADGGQQDAPWVVLADAEGAEFRVLTPR
jgi:hypothetical protein